jgi:hypothetical protein
MPVQAKKVFNPNDEQLAEHLKHYRKKKTGEHATIILLYITKEYGEHGADFNHFGCLRIHRDGFTIPEMKEFQKLKNI